MSIIAVPPSTTSARPALAVAAYHDAPASDVDAASVPLRLTVDISVPPGPLAPATARLLDLLAELAAADLPVRSTPSVDGDRRPALTVVPDLDPVAAPVMLRLRPESREAWLSGRPLPLTRLEYDLLAFLAERPRQVFSRRQLLTRVWGREPAHTRTVDVHVRRLRAKFGGTPVVTTVHRVGYRLARDLVVEVDRGTAALGGR